MKRLLILSGKGGTGKTTVAAAFVKLSNALAVADCDVDAPNLHLILNENGSPERKEFIGSKKASINAEKCISCGLCAEKCRFEAIKKENNRYFADEYSCEGCGVCTLVCSQGAITLSDDVAGEQLLYKGDRIFSTATLKMSRGNSGKLVTKVKLDMLKNVPSAPLAVVDGSPGVGCPVIASLSGMDLALIVAEPSFSGLSDLKRLVETALTLNTPLAVCVNKYDLSPQHTQQIKEFCNDNQIHYLGQIPYDKNASAAINQGKSLVDFPCQAQKALADIYENVLKLLEIKNG